MVDIANLINEWMEKQGLKPHFAVIQEDSHVDLISHCTAYGIDYKGSFGKIDTSTGQFEFMEFVTPVELKLRPLNIGSPSFFRSFKNHLKRIHEHLSCKEAFGKVAGNGA